MIYKDIDEMKAKADEGEIDAMVQLGMSYLYGYGVEKDYVQAFIYLQDAAIRNDGEAQLHLGKMYENGWGIKKDPWTAYSLYRRSYKAKTEGLRKALEDLCHQAEASVDEGVNYIILSDRDLDEKHAAIPSLLAVSAVTMTPKQANSSSTG